MTRIPWIGLAALVVGFAAGLTFAWILVPDRDQGTAPHSLRADYRDQWREVIAASYGVTGDLRRARSRLQLIQDTDSIQALGAQAQRALASGRPFEVAQDLARLASDLQVGVSSVPSRVPSPLVSGFPYVSALPDLPTDAPASAVSASPPPGVSSNNEVTPFPMPSAIPTTMPSPSVPFQLLSQDEFCDPKAKAGMLQVIVLDAEGNPLPGVEITITWSQGADRFFTGLQPEISPGHADYTMKGGITYSLQVARLGVPVSGLIPPVCTAEDNRPYLGGLQVTFAAR